MLKVITGQNDTAANVIPQNKKNQYRVDSAMHYNASIKCYVLTIKADKTNVSSTHIEQKTCRTVKYYTTVNRRKYQLHFENVVKSIIVMVRLKADNELKSVMFSGK